MMRNFFLRLLLAQSLLGLAACNLFGEDVASVSSTVQTSVFPASVPYYLDLCGQEENSARYGLIAPAKLDRWMAGTTDVAKKRRACASERTIENGDPITVRLHRVGVGGLAEFDEKGACRKGCLRDVAIVIDFNGSETLQKPIVAFYQRNVPPDANLQFTNFTIYTQNEWYYRYPPSVRVRLYDVRVDKDQELRAQLDAIGRGKDQILSYVAGAAIAGPLIDTAIDVAKRLTSGPRNRPILDMAFQLFPQEQDAGSAGGEGQQRQQAEAQRAAQQSTSEISATDLSFEEIAKLQEKFGVDLSQGGRGILGPQTRAALEKANSDLSPDKAGTSEYNRRARAFLTSSMKSEVAAAQRNDSTFGAPIFASQFIVFNENALPIKGCSADWRLKAEQARAMFGGQLPSYYFIPDGVRFGGARVYGALNGNDCMLESPYVVFAITRESAAVAVDVAKRISDLQAKFTASASVSEDSITSLGAALVDAELALAIDRLENGRKADQLIALTARLRDQYQKKDANNGLPLPSATFRSRAFRLIGDYTGCTISEGADAAYLDKLLLSLKYIDQSLRRGSGWQKPYFGGRLPADFKCPALAALPEQAPTPLPSAPPAPSPTGGSDDDSGQTDSDAQDAQPELQQDPETQ